MKSRLFFFFVSSLFATNGYAQPIQEIENKIADYLYRIDKWSHNSTNYDSLGEVNTVLIQYLKKIGKEQPATISAPFYIAQSLHLKILTSDDGKFRIYNWDSNEGGTMHFFNTIAQYGSNKMTHTVSLDTEKDPGEDGTNPGYMYTKIATIHRKDNKVFYLAFYTGIYSTKDVSKGVRAFSLDDDRLNDSIAIFKTSNRFINRIDYGYNYFSNYNDQTMKENNIIYLSSDQQKLYIPVVDGEKITSKYLIYRFDGNNYVFDKNLKQ